jgi:serine/threonine protein kinase
LTSTALPKNSHERPITSGAERDPFDLVGDVIDSQFRVDEIAGEGTLSVIYRGHHLGVDATVSIKCLDLPSTLDPQLVAPVVRGFREGCRLQYRLALDNLDIAQTLGSGTTLAPRTGVEVPYVVREWLEGHSLATELAWRRVRGLKGQSLAAAMSLLDGAARGLSFAHVRKTAHLAIDPTNLFLVTMAKERRVKILDFGLAAALRGAVPEGGAAGLYVLPIEHAAPEQLDKALGQTGLSTDVYALAIVLLEVLSDRQVVDGGETGAMIARVLDPKRRPHPRDLGIALPRAVEDELARAVSLDPSQRHADVGAFWQALESAADGAPARAPSPVAPSPAAPAPAPVAASPTEPIVAPQPTLIGVPELPNELPEEPPPPAPFAVPLDTPSGGIELPPRFAAPPSMRAKNVRFAAAAAALFAAAFAITMVALARGPTRSAHASRGAPVARDRAVASRFTETRAAAAPRAGLPFFHGAAIRALSQTGSLSSCSEGKKLWGSGSARVDFAPDGAVSRVELGWPFAGTSEGACVIEKLSTARVRPFAGTGSVFFKFFVPRPTTAP